VLESGIDPGCVKTLNQRPGKRTGRSDFREIPFSGF